MTTSDRWPRGQSWFWAPMISSIFCLTAIYERPHSEGTEVIPMPKPLPDKPRVAGGFDFQAKQPHKPSLLLKAAEDLHHQFTKPKCTTGSRPRYQIVWSPDA
jgi:hypothetical protein